MNCNPFTNGHRYLIEKAANQVDNLFVFVVQEDQSYFRFEDRIDMVRDGTSDIENVYVYPSSNYMISAVTLPGYFDKQHLGNINVSATDDLELFVSIVKELNVKVRFAGSEPSDKFTNSYNLEMTNILPQYGIRFEEIERIADDSGEVISASIVREFIKNHKIEKIQQFVPDSTYNILLERGYI